MSQFATLEAVVQPPFVFIVACLFVFVKSSKIMTTSNRIVRLRITDASGHTELAQDLATAIQTVLDAHLKNKQWAYVGSRVFQFSATSADDPALLQDAARLRQMIEESSEDIVVTLTGDLVGGNTSPITVTLRITDASGHTETIEELSAGIAKVIDAHLKNKKWAYVNSQVFQFDEDALRDPVALVAETQRLFETVQSAANNGPVVITLTGDLVGGASK